MNSQPEKVSLAILAGGRSSRMGEDKALKPFLGQALIRRVANRLSSLADETLVVTDRLEAYAFLGLPIVPDVVPARGTLGGLYTAMARASFPVVAAVGCDMPFACSTLFQAAIRLLVEEDLDAVVPRLSSGLEPLHAVYHRSACLPAIRSAVEAGQLKAIDWLPQVRLRELGVEEFSGLDPAGLAFWNINTPEEFNEAERMAKTLEQQ
jgi:molybdopterin-guanine dinucleotide biosynthesis protein A